MQARQANHFTLVALEEHPFYFRSIAISLSDEGKCYTRTDNFCTGGENLMDDAHNTHGILDRIVIVGPKTDAMAHSPVPIYDSSRSW
jgi:hypothetical protein